MDQNQKRYAMQGIDTSLTQKIDDLRVKHTKKAKVVSDGEKLNAIRNSDVYIKSYGVSLNTTLRDAFDFRRMAGADALDEAAFRKAKRAVEAAAAKVKDEIMLGDDKKAIALIRKFCGE